MAKKMKTCKVCGCSCGEQTSSKKDSLKAEEVKSYHAETGLAMMLALVPAMTMTLFSLMGLV